jgi:ribose transport system permease protein
MSADDHTALRTSAPPTPAIEGPPVGGPAPSRRFRLNVASAPIVLATIALFLVSLIFEPDSVRHSALLGMLPLAGVLAILAMGQTLVIQQGGIDLSVPGMVSLGLVLVTHYPNGDSSRLGVAIALAFMATIVAGLVTGVIVSYVGVTPIVATLGMNAVLYGFVLSISGGNPTPTTSALSKFAGGKLAGIPTAVIVAVVLALVTALIIKRTVAGRRFEAVGAGLFGARAAGLEARRYKLAAYVAAGALYGAGAILLGGIVGTPNLFQGDSYLLPSVTAVVLGGTSLLGGRGSVIATAVAALFISQLDQFILVLGANNGVQNLVDAGALAAGLAIYSVPWKRLRGHTETPSPDRPGATEPEPGRKGPVSRGAQVAPGSHK